MMLCFAGKERQRGKRERSAVRELHMRVTICSPTGIERRLEGPRIATFEREDIHSDSI